MARTQGIGLADNTGVKTDQQKTPSASARQGEKSKPTLATEVFVDRPVAFLGGYKMLEAHLAGTEKRGRGIDDGNRAPLC
jgi:hypothetical protein